jgi:N-acetyl-anhydromuramyl-L-alanine amidase AmpD
MTKPELWYPNAIRTSVGMSRKHRYATGFPRGLVVHYNAGSFDGDAATSCLAYGKANGFVYHTLARDGTLYQDVPFDVWGSHAGVSAWTGIDGHVSDELVGVEIMSAGILTKQSDGNGKTYWGATIQKDQCREVTQPRYYGETHGLYHAYSAAQEHTLTELCLWLKSQAPTIFMFENVVGHDEVRAAAGKLGDKQDPGGALSIAMPEFRTRLAAEYAKR